MLPFSNADLLEVRGAGGTDDWNGTTQGAIAWQGTADAYYRESADAALGEGAGANIWIRRSVVVSSYDPPIDLPVGAVLTLRLRESGNTIIGRIQDGGDLGGSTGGGRRSEAPIGVPDTLATTKVWLEST